MEFDHISAVVKPRNPWEAADLGIKLARTWFSPIIKTWLLVTLPAFILLSILLHSTPVIAILIFWWLKPLWERPILFILSRALFGEIPDIKETIRNFPKLAGNQVLSSLFWRRFSMTRSMDLSVIQLENLKGDERNRRLKVLHNMTNNGAFWLTFACMNIEGVLVLGMFFLAILLTPDSMNIDWFGFLNSNKGDYLVIQNIVFYIAITMVAPFYIACGFALYINRRTLLEAWDIEIGFRNLRKRLNTIKIKSTSILLLLLVLLSGNIIYNPVVAAELTQKNDSELSSKTINNIMKEDEFHNIRKYRIPKIFDNPDKRKKQIKSPFPAWLLRVVVWLSRSMEFILWAVVFALVLIFAHNYRDWLFSHMLPHRKSRLNNQDNIPKTMFGMPVGSENLPKNITAQVKQLWISHDYRNALSLLYRATLTNLIEKHNVGFHESHTEGECVKLVTNSLAPDISKYFSELTGYWCYMAYAHQLPPNEKITDLCNQWQHYFPGPEK